jgi:hypothetical protein
MTPSVKLRTCARLRGGFLAFTVLLAGGTFLIAAPREEKIVLWKNTAPPSGTSIREIREIVGENGKRTITQESDTSVNGLRYVHRVNMVRRIVGNDRIQVSVRDNVRECFFYLGNTPPPANPLATPLSAQDLRMRRVSGRWQYELDNAAKPTEPQQFALSELGQFADLLGVLAYCYTRDPRAKGETWKVTPPRPPGKGYGMVETESLECRLEDVVDGEGGQIARIAVAGKLKIERPMNLNGSVAITFAGTIMHRLSDMLDVDTNLTGTFSYTGPVMALGKPAKADIELPWKLTRTQKIEPK